MNYKLPTTVICRLSSVVCLLSSLLYICRESSTNQLLFMQNKPNFRKSKMNVNSFYTVEYENKRYWTLSENKPNSNPNKPNFQNAQMNVNLTLTKDYRKKDDFAVRINKPNSKPISSKAKMNANAFSQKDYENEPPSGSKKTNPKQTQFQTGHLLIDRTKRIY